MVEHKTTEARSVCLWTCGDHGRFVACMYACMQWGRVQMQAGMWSVVAVRTLLLRSSIGHDTWRCQEALIIVTAVCLTECPPI
uniref:Uncharacterized protein n=1 Tax=Arundo donax TaxID=35708 RepID=A0A0A9DJD6_ARUDO